MKNFNAYSKVQLILFFFKFYFISNKFGSACINFIIQKFQFNSTTVYIFIYIQLWKLALTR